MKDRTVTEISNEDQEHERARRRREMAEKTTRPCRHKRVKNGICQECGAEVG